MDIGEIPQILRDELPEVCEALCLWQTRYTPYLLALRSKTLDREVEMNLSVEYNTLKAMFELSNNAKKHEGVLTLLALVLIRLQEYTILMLNANSMVKAKVMDN